VKHRDPAKSQAKEEAPRRPSMKASGGKGEAGVPRNLQERRSELRAVGDDQQDPKCRHLIDYQVQQLE
jgi:hypothetical protein